MSTEPEVQVIRPQLFHWISGKWEDMHTTHCGLTHYEADGCQQFLSLIVLNNKARLELPRMLGEAIQRGELVPCPDCDREINRKAEEPPW